MNIIWLLLILAWSNQNGCSSNCSCNSCSRCSNNNNSNCNRCPNKPKPECEVVCEAACEAAKEAAREEDCGCRRGFPINSFPVLDN